MSSDLWQPVLAGLAGLIVAVLGYLTAVTQAHTRTLAAQHAALMTQLVANGQAAPPSPAGAGAAAAMRRAPRWNQLADPLPDGTLPAYRYEECGEECVAEVLYAQHGVAVEADWVRYQLGGPGRRGLTNGADLVRALLMNNVTAQLATPAAPALAALLQEVAADGRMAIVLGAWVQPGVLHWVLVDRADARGCGYNDPWGGVRRAATWAEMAPKYAGQLVEVVRAPDTVG